MATSAISRGADAGTRWARGLPAPEERRRLVAALDRMIESDVWNYRLIFISIVRARSSTRLDFMTRWFGGGSASAADAWWREAGGTTWPQNDEDRQRFVRGFVIGAALEMRSTLTA